MRFLLVVALGVVSAMGHNLDEFLQAALLEVSRDRVEISLRLTPGPAVFAAFSGMIDRDGDGQYGAKEVAKYQSEALRDWSVWVDGSSVALSCEETRVAPMQELREGMGGLELRCTGEFRGMAAGKHHLRFRNDHQPTWSVYMMNALQPSPGVTIDKQTRDSLQREITIEFESQGQARQAGSWWLGAMIAPLLLRAGFLASGMGRKT